MSSRIARIISAFAVVVIASAPAACGLSGERIAVPTSEGYDFADFRSDPAQGTTISGVLVVPSSGPILGAAILSHGAGGTGARQRRAARLFAEAGIAAFVLDHFTARGVSSVARDQLRITEQQMASDIFAARDVLSERLELDGARIGAVGWSKGGTAVTLSAVGRLGRFVAPQGEPLGFAAAFYPFCGFQLDEEALSTPLLMLLAGQDDWTPSAPCLRQIKAWASAGENAEWVLYNEASHGFDSRSGRFRVDQAITVRDTGPGCTLDVDEGGRTVTIAKTLSLTTLEERRQFLAACGERGVTFEGDAKAGPLALERLLSFVTDRLR
ncbi:MAG: dienelactone hydrolase family protein [Pseudomonadota bacterium]